MKPISTCISSETCYSEDLSSCNNDFSPYWSFHSEERSFSKRQSLRQKPTPLPPTSTKPLPEHNWNAPQPSHLAQVAEQRWVKKSQLMRCRDECNKGPSTGKRRKGRFDIPDRKTSQKYVKPNQKDSLGLPTDENNIQLSHRLIENRHLYEPVIQAKNSLSSQDHDSSVQNVSPYHSQETSVDEDPFLLIFPRRERGYVAIKAEDLKLLEPRGMLNDNLVDFMLKYIEMYQVPYMLQGKVHFFNSFFFTRLQSLGYHTSHGNIECLSRWTSGIEILSKKFLFIPICVRHHWTLAVVCNPGNLLSWNSSYSDPKERPCILYFDSLGTFSLSGNCQRLLRCYLEMEYRRRQSSCPMEEPKQTICIPRENLVIWNVSAAPQQKNEFDCGLFMLLYIIRFLQEPPNGGSFTRKADLGVKNWFTDKDIKVFREKMKQLIVDLANYHMSHPIEQQFGGNSSLNIQESTSL
ncbi:hypothetical protein GpartN1_g41.t1 [Galdieria partita]|uniref:Ubiquitin-like protease family profile domain-containing protein n=1 Tax=Galdieria partita TaxID=83374 RepID=A0A9C7PPQ1_9RHOD|nr:hypothetical protein GpartN1_g41.t1 [Galdieria partita]